MIHENIRLCPNCGHGSSLNASRCSHCGTVLGVSRLKALSRQNGPDGYLGLASLIIAFIGLALFKVAGTKATFGVGILAAALGSWAFRKDEQPGLALFAIIIAILDVFVAIVAPVF
jgi:hypothetical protein